MTPMTIPATCLTLATSLSAVALPTPDLTVHDAERIIERLNIDDDDRQRILRDLLETYALEIRKAEESLQQAIADLATQEDSEAYIVKMLAQTQAFLASCTAASKRIDLDIAAILLDEELEGWQSLRRSMRRDRQLPLGRLIAERLDLATLTADQFGPESPPEVADIVARWGLAIDEAIRARRPLLGPENNLYRSLIHQERYQEAYAVCATALEARIRIRDLTLASLRAIEASLPPETAALVHAEALARMGQRPVTEGLSAALSRLSASSECQDLLAREESLAIEDFLQATTGLADELLEIRMALETARILGPIGSKVGHPADLEAVQSRHLQAIVRLRTAEEETLDALCARVGRECCDGRPVRPMWPRKDTPEEMIDPGGVRNEDSPLASPPESPKAPTPEEVAPAPSGDPGDPHGPDTPNQDPPPEMEPPSEPDPPSPHA